MNQSSGFTLDSTGYLSQEDTKRYYSRIGLFCFILAAVSFLISLAAVFLIRATVPSLINSDLKKSLLNHILSFLSIYCIAVPVAILALKPLPTVKPIKEKLSFGKFLGAFCVCFTFLQVGAYISNFLVSIIQRLSGKEITNPLAETFSIGNLAVDAIFIGILFPILEELLFRKILCQRLLPIGEKKAVIISAAVFGLIHGNLYQFAYAFLIGLVLGYVYVKTGRLIYPIICHCAINLYAGVFSSYVVSKVRIEKIYEIMMSENAMSDPEALLGQLAPYASDLTVYLIYTYLLLGLSIAGFAVLLVSVIKKKITFEQGILPTPKKGRISNFFLTGGVAEAIGFLVFKFIFSIFI